MMMIMIVYYYIDCDHKHFYCIKSSDNIINPRRACAARVTVVVSCVCLYVCMSVRTRYSGSTRD